MKALSIIFTVLSLMLFNSIFSQQNTDTIDIRNINVVDFRIPKSYKVSILDSATVSSSINLSELLQKHSTVFIKDYGSGALASVSFRGTGASHTKVLWNNVPLNSPMNGQIDFSLYPTLFFNNVALHHGASGLMDGNGALGGSVLLNNAVFFKKNLKINTTQSLGSFSNYTTAIKIINATPKWFLETQLYTKASKNDFEFVNTSKIGNPLDTQINANLNQYGLQQAVYYKLKNGKLGGRFWYFNSNRRLAPNMLAETNNEHQKDESIRALIEWDGLLNNFKYKWINSLVKNQLIYINTPADIHSNNNSYNINSKYLTSYYLNNRFTLTNNFSFNYESAKADGYLTDYNRIKATWLAGISRKKNRLNIDVFNRLTKIGEYLQAFAPSAAINYGFFKQKELLLKANIGINYNYPTFNDLYWNPGGNPNLKPEYAKMSEIGFSYTHQRQATKIKLEATGFYSRVKDWIIWLPTENGFWSPNNLREVENKGIELFLTTKTKLKNIHFISTVNYSNTHSTNLKAKNKFDNSLNKQLIYVPFHQLNYTLKIAYKKIFISYLYSYTGKRFMTTDNNWYLPANYLSDISVGKDFQLKNKFYLSTTFKIKNLLNQDYQSIAWRPMPRRNYIITLSLNFN